MTVQVIKPEYKPSIPLERAGAAKMAVIMILAGIIFLTNPNPGTFEILNESGWSLTADQFGNLCFLGALLFIGIIVFRDLLISLKIRIRRTIFLAGSFPLAMYTLAVSVIAFNMRSYVTVIAYIGLYMVVFLSAFAIYNGYSKFLERAVLLTVMGIMALLTVSFAFARVSGAFAAFNVSPMGFSILSLIGGIGCSLLFFPRIKALPNWIKRLWLNVSELSLPTYAILIGFHMLQTGGSLIISLVLIDIYLLIALMGYVLYPRTDLLHSE